MTTTPETSTDVAVVQHLSRRFAGVFEDPDAAGDVFSADVFFDLNMPVWRMQLQGPGAFTAQLKQISDGEVHIDVLRTVPTASGFVTEHEEHQSVNGHDLTARRLWLCRVRDGAIVEAVGYCSGEWDDELRARHAAEAPMIRP
ncbi:MAG: hypothetical protein MUP97_06675 [Acidimicrobiia bacterium]|nr:hypothetical protein [Acidimicrobiia bacterium]